MKIIDKIIQSETEPDVHSLWLHPKGELKYNAGVWKSIKVEGGFSGNAKDLVIDPVELYPGAPLMYLIPQVSSITAILKNIGDSQVNIEIPLNWVHNNCVLSGPTEEGGGLEESVFVLGFPIVSADTAGLVSTQLYNKWNQAATPAWDNVTGKPTFSAVATSGSYNDLTGKPAIPSAYTLPTASASVLGGVKSSTTGTTSGRDYKVQVNSDGTMKVNVPWTDNNTTYAQATDYTLGLVKIGYTENGKNYPVELSGRGQMFVNVPWTDTTYRNATTAVAGLMSSQDKSKLDGIARGANNYVLPNATTEVVGGVKKATNVKNVTIDGTETAAIVGNKVNELIAALKAAGIM